MNICRVDLSSKNNTEQTEAAFTDWFRIRYGPESLQGEPKPFALNGQPLTILNGIICSEAGLEIDGKLPEILVNEGIIKTEKEFKMFLAPFKFHTDDGVNYSIRNV